MSPHTATRLTAVALAAATIAAAQPLLVQNTPRLRKVTPATARHLDAIKIINGPRPAGGYLYPDRVGDRWDLTKRFHYSYGVPPEVMSQWAPYVMAGPPHDPQGQAQEMARLKDEDPKLAGFQTTVDGRPYTLDQRLYDLGVASVRDFGAVGDGRHDDTDALQLAIDFARDNRLVCYFPAGDYLVSHTLLGYHLFEIWHNGTLHAAHENHLCLVGPSHGPRARIVLKEGTFPKRIPKQRRFVIWTQHLKSMRTLGSNRKLSYESGPFGDNDSASFFCPAIRHLDIVVQPDNAGASGLYFVAAEQSTLRDVRVIFEPNPDGSPNGEAGFVGLPGSGGSVHNLVVRGGSVAIDLTGMNANWQGRSLGSWSRAATRPAPTVSNSEFVGQTDAVVRGQAQGTLTIVGCRFAMATGQPVFKMTGASPESTPAVIDSVIEYPDDSPAAMVVQPADRSASYPAFYFENCYVKNAVALDPSGAFALRKSGWYHIRRAARTRRTRTVQELLRVPAGESGKWIPWKRTDPRCAIKDGQLLFDARPIQLPARAKWKLGGPLMKGERSDPNEVAVTLLLGEPIVVDGRATFDPLLVGEPAGDGAYWEQMRRAHMYRRELGFDSPGLTNVKTFGATGDGQADDTEALRRAVASGKDLLLPRGIYRMSGPLRLKPGQSLVGVDKSWSVLWGAEIGTTVFGGAARNSAAGQAALDRGVPVVATATDDDADDTLCDLGLWLTYGYKEAKTRDDARVGGYLLLVQGGGCEVIDVAFHTSKNPWPETAAEAARSPYGGWRVPGARYMDHPQFQVAAGGGVKVYNGSFCGGHHYPLRGAYLLLANQRHPVEFYHLQIQTPTCFGLRMAGSTGGMRAYGIKTEHGTDCLLFAEKSRNFGWYGYGAGGAPRPERTTYDGLPAANYRIEDCDDFLVAAFSQRVQHMNYLTYDAIREVRNGVVAPLDRAFRPILYLRGNPKFAGE